MSEMEKMIEKLKSLDREEKLLRNSLHQMREKRYNNMKDKLERVESSLINLLVENSVLKKENERLRIALMKGQWKWLQNQKKE